VCEYALIILVHEHSKTRYTGNNIFLSLDDRITIKFQKLYVSLLESVLVLG